MRQLTIALAGEGNTDYQLLIPLVDRIVSYLIPHIELLLFDIQVAGEEKLLQIARKAHAEFVIFHLDADSSSTEKAYQRFLPKYQAIQTLADVTHTFIPLIPVRNIEAWMLVDFEAFKAVVGTKLTPKELGFPEKAKAIEKIKNPKGMLESAITRSRQGRQIKTEEVFEGIGQRLNLDLLKQVPAYQEFEARLIAILRDLHLYEE